MARLDVPLLVSVSVLLVPVVPVCWVVNGRHAGEMVTVWVTVPVPLPLSATSSGLSAALSVSVSAPEIDPETLGVKVAYTAQVPPTETEPEQVLLNMP